MEAVKEIAEIFKQLTAEDKEKALAYLRELVEKQEAEKKAN